MLRKGGTIMKWYVFILRKGDIKTKKYFLCWNMLEAIEKAHDYAADIGFEVYRMIL